MPFFQDGLSEHLFMSSYTSTYYTRGVVLSIGCRERFKHEQLQQETLLPPSLISPAKVSGAPHGPR